ncbi:hypothetical protein CTI12_AA094710 [Artemisia annua]|uniref:Uncharacterized protein n=1 Tax=Artemisia annua TaxID=35608 RepID=A0A2U1PYV0_ARTAN|nr:hypothetical protein CTI12_AA094710 [Artemisia annua]
MDSTRENTAEDHSNVQVEINETPIKTHSHDVIQPGNVEAIINFDEHDQSDEQEQSGN